MHDDREEFEQDQVGMDQEGADIAYRDSEDEAWISRGELARKVDRAMERLDAEVAAHEGGKVELVIENLTGEEVEYAVLGPPLGDFPDPDFAADGKMHGAAAGDEILPEADAEQFGARLRGAIGRNGLLHGWGFLAGISLTEKQVVELDRIADAIDQDAAGLTTERDEALSLLSAHQRQTAINMYNLRQQVEQLVEELRYSVGGNALDVSRDVLDAEPFLERLAEIFGAHPEHGMIVGGLSDEPESAASEPPSAQIIDLMEALKASLAQHEPAHDRRERQSARYEDREGRVEGVDR